MLCVLFCAQRLCLKAQKKREGRVFRGRAGKAFTTLTSSAQRVNVKKKISQCKFKKIGGFYHLQCIITLEKFLEKTLYR